MHCTPTSPNLIDDNLKILGSTIIILGSILQASSFERIQLIVGRVVAGVGNGLNTCAIPTWQAEMLPPRNRGAVLNIQAA